ncbi:MAG TPA: hypothetical protein VFQ21_08930 [Gemmatimonadota bacterium]|nr:hypothetical protein [Gemmatimonadota bacterium]
MRAEAGLTLASATVAAFLALAPALPAQESSAPDTLTMAVVPFTALEPAIYDTGGRRDPFAPLTVGGDIDSGPRFETLRLTGVFLGAPGNSLVVLEDPTRRGHFLRVGERLGQARLIQIMPDGAAFEVEEYGIGRREVLRLERSEENP